MRIGFWGNDVTAAGTFVGGESMRASDIAKAVGGEFFGVEETAVFGMCTDSREVQRGIMFIAIKGERVDGHDYIEKAIALGCDGFLCQRLPDNFSEYADKAVFVVVDDTVAALGRLAAAQNEKLNIKTVGVTGSVGKTTTKEIIGCILGEKFVTHRTAGNFNSAIGLPLVILETPKNTEINILEMGMGNRGEISYLSTMAKPQAAIITNIGHAHIESLGTRENIRDAKLEITDGLRDGGFLLINGDEPLLSDYKNTKIKILRVSLSKKNCDFYAKNIKLYFDKCIFDIVDNINNTVTENIIINISGEHNVYAAVFGYALASAVFGMNGEAIKIGIGKYKSVGLRQKTTDIYGYTLIEDCYNAGPESMCASIKNLFELGRQSRRRTVAVLGDMLGLGQESERLHRLVGEKLSKTPPKKLVLFGKDAALIGEEAVKLGYGIENISIFQGDSHEICAEKLHGMIRPDDILLFKASRGMCAELISERLKDLIKKTGEKANE